MAGQSKINPELDKAITKLLRGIDACEDVETKLAIIDRSIKYEALKLKAEDSEDGAEFDQD